MFLGLMILVVGIVFLMQNLGYISGSVWEILWPSFLIITGLVMIFRQKDSYLNVFRKNK
jgi:hypothetical protein